MNVKMAMRKAKKLGIEVKNSCSKMMTVLQHQKTEIRKKDVGVAGEVLMWKVGGAKAPWAEVLMKLSL